MKKFLASIRTRCVTISLLVCLLATISSAFHVLSPNDARRALSSSVPFASKECGATTKSIPPIFVPGLLQIERPTRITSATRTTRLYNNLFGNLFGGNDDKSGNEAGASNIGNANDPVVDVMNIPAKVIKTKPLKFFLQLFFVGKQNEPFKGAWLLNANEEVEEYLEVYFSDGTGMLSVQFDPEYGLKIQRKGKRPSLQYMLQESVLLHLVLDELEAIAFGQGDDDGQDVKEEERLLQFTDENKDILSRAREKLPARAEKPSE